MRSAVIASVMLLAMVLTTAWVRPLREVPGTAVRFVSYMDRMEKSGQRLSFWDRVTYGLALAGTKRKAKRPVS